MTFPAIWAGLVFRLFDLGSDFGAERIGGFLQLRRLLTEGLKPFETAFLIRWHLPAPASAAH